MRSRPAPFRPALLALALAMATARDAGAAAAGPGLDLPGPRTLGRPSFHFFGEDGGGDLAHTAIESLALDPGGELWVGSQDGAAAYDGRTFREIRLPRRELSNWVHAILPRADGSVFFATDAGVSRRTESPFAVASWEHWSAAEGGLPGDVVRALADYGGSVVAGTEKGLARLEGDRFAPLKAQGLPPDLEIFRLATAGGELWIGSGVGLGRLADGVYTAEPLFAGAKVTALFADHRGLLAATASGVYRRDNGDAAWRPLVADPGAFRDWRVSAIARAGDPEQVFLGGDRGLARLAGGELCFWGYAEGLTIGSVRTLLVTPGPSADLLFLGPTSGGLMRAILNGWNVLDGRGAPLPRDDINAIGEAFCCGAAAGDPGPARDGDPGVVYFFGTETGLARFSAGRWDLFTTANSDLPSDNVNGVLQAQDGEVYFATEEGLLVAAARDAVAGPLRGQVFRPESSPLPHAAILTLLRSSEGGMWIATRGGLARRRADHAWGEVYRPGPGALPDAQVYAVAELTAAGRRQLWVGTRRGGLALLENGVWRTFQPGRSPLPNPWVNCLELAAAPDGRLLLWVGTDGGAVRLDPAAPESPWRLLDERSEPALPNQGVLQIRHDRRGRLLFFTNRGIARGRPDSDEILEVLRSADGLPANDFTSWGTLVDRRGRLWGGTGRGLAIYDDALATASLAPPNRLRWQAVEIEGRQSDAPAAPGELPTLAWNDRLLLRYQLPRLAGGEGTTFRTQLLGLEEAPAAPTPMGERLFSHLPSGSYLFRVVATDARGRSSLPLELAFEVAPAPWLATWALALYALGGGGFVAFVLYRREAAQRAHQAALEALVAERTASLTRSETEARQAREEAEEANRVKGRFLANMSHELRTPLNGVIGLTSLLGRTALDPSQRRYLENLRTSGQHLLALVSDVLDFEKIAAGNLELDPQPVETAAFLESLIQAVRPDAEAKELELILVGADELPPRVELDARRLRQVLLNLLSNAVKFTHSGRVTLAATAEKLGGADLRFTFSVHDTGIGIPHERLGRLFKPFSQVDSSTTRIYGGTGLGLAICKALVERMGGAIEVETRSGVGSCFRFTCLAQVATGQDRAGEGPGAGRRGGSGAVRRVLLAEDQPINQIVAVAMLEELGCTVTLAADGRAAVDAAGDVAEGRFDLIVLDLQMPELDGLEAARRIRRVSPGTPIVLLTADVRPEIRARAAEEGIDDFLAKPVQLEDFADLLRRIEEQRAAG